MTDVEQRVRSVLADVFGLDAAAIGPDTSTDTVEGWDSLHHLTVVLSLVNFPLIALIVNEHLDSSASSETAPKRD